MPRIVINVIEHEQQRYPTIGDWELEPDGTWAITVSDMHNWRYEVLVAVHELVEMALCLDRDISEKAVTQFDEYFESTREKGNMDEPGDDADAPYRDEHCFATGIERLLASALKLSWQEYDDKVNSL